MKPFNFGIFPQKNACTHKYMIKAVCGGMTNILIGPKFVKLPTSFHIHQLKWKFWVFLIGYLTYHQPLLLTPLCHLLINSNRSKCNLSTSKGFEVKWHFIGYERDIVSESAPNFVLQICFCKKVTLKQKFVHFEIWENLKFICKSIWNFAQVW